MKQKQIQPRNEVSAILRRRNGKQGRNRTFQTEGQRSLSHDKIIIQKLLSVLLLSNDLFSLRRELGGTGWLARLGERRRKAARTPRGGGVRIDGRQKSLVGFCFG